MDTRRTGRVFIVEDSPSIRSRLVELVGEVDGMCVVGEAETPAEAIAGISETQPDCVVLDFQLIGGTAVDVLRAVHPASPEIAFVVLTNHPNAAIPPRLHGGGRDLLPGQEHRIRQAQGRGRRMHAGAALIRPIHRTAQHDHGH